MNDLTLRCIIFALSEAKEANTYRRDYAISDAKKRYYEGVLAAIDSMLELFGKEDE